MSIEVQDIFEAANPVALEGRCVALLNAGELVVLPTETVYGAAGRLDRPAAVDKLRSLRKDSTGPFTLHVASAEDAIDLIGEPAPLAARMMRKLWPGPVALVLDVPDDRRKALAARLKLSDAELFGENGTVVLRCPDHPFTTEVLEHVDGPVAFAAIETRSGELPFGDEPTATLAPLDGKVALALDGGRTRFSKPSTIVRVEGDRFTIVREGVFDARIIERQLRTNILFVCSGNTCRSPMAAAVASRMLQQEYGVDEAGLDKLGIGVISAGSYAMPGLRATPQAVEAVAQLGGDLSNHRSRSLTPELIHAADVIYTMTRSHADAVRGMSPTAASRIVPLDPDGDVEDPIGGPLSLYRDVAGRFQTLIADRFAESVYKLHPPTTSTSSGAGPRPDQGAVEGQT